MAVAAIGLVTSVAGAARANGRPPGASTINFRQTHEQDVIAGLTFGAAISHDGGATWHWFCEDAIGYGGMYDPDYAYSRTGKIFATTTPGRMPHRGRSCSGSSSRLRGSGMRDSRDDTRCGS